MTYEPTDELLDAVAAALTDELQNPSTIARRAKVSTTDAYAALGWLRRNRFLVASGNGCWTKYRNRRTGELSS